MRLALVIPALNEEEAIGGTLRRALAAREKVVSQTPVTEMILVFVNDGSTDRTQEIVDQSEFNEVVKVHFEKNRGYGAAIKAGWQAVDAELVGFMDADGTCDPDFCVKLLDRMFEADADVILAGRLNPESEMPLIRKVGNILFARLLGLVSGQDLTDSASGFRIVKRSSMRLVCPLPDGLHFTPAMSAICLLDPRLRIEEVPMPYKERIGRSKLNVIKDGLRFLFVILFSACCYSPIKTMLGASVLAGVGWAWLAMVFGGSTRGTVVFGFTGLMMLMLLVGSGVIVHQLNFLLIGPRRHVGSAERKLQWLLEFRRLIAYGGAVALLGALGLLGYGVLAEGQSVGGLVVMMVFMFISLLGGAMVIGGVIMRVVWAVGEKQKALIEDEYTTHAQQGPSQAVSLETTQEAGGGSVSALGAPH